MTGVQTCALPISIVGFFRIIREESAYALPEIDPVYARNNAEMFIRDHKLTWVAVHEGRVIGCFMGAVVSFSWTPKPSAIENVHLGVLQEYRRFGVAEVLLKRVKESSSALGLPIKLQIDFGEEKADLKERFVKRAGFAYVGSNFIFAPQAPEAVAHEAPPASSYELVSSTDLSDLASQVDALAQAAEQG